MRGNLSSTTSVAFAAVLCLLADFTWASSDSERIRALEMLVEQQQRMLENMNVELQRLKAGQTVIVEDIVIVDETITEPVTEQKAKPESDASGGGHLVASVVGGVHLCLGCHCPCASPLGALRGSRHRARSCARRRRDSW